jgi:hypothetical protein
MPSTKLLLRTSESHKRGLCGNRRRLFVPDGIGAMLIASRVEHKPFQRPLAPTPSCIPGVQGSSHVEEVASAIQQVRRWGAFTQLANKTAQGGC